VGSILRAIFAVETVALVLLFPKFKERMLQRKEARERFLRSLQRPKPLLSRHQKKPRPSEGRSQLLIPARPANPSQQNPEEAITAVRSYMGFDTREEADAIYAEAKDGSAVAQFIVGMALLLRSRSVGKAWLRLSAEQGFGPARDHLGKEAG
jgi:hypothetical protein